MQFKLIVILLTFIVYSMTHAEDKIQEIKLHDSNYLEVIITENNVVGVEFDGSRMKLISNINNSKIYRSTYELVPMIGELAVTLRINDAYYVKRTKINVIYNTKLNIKTINDNWNLNSSFYYKDNIFILKSKANNLMEYQKNLDTDFILSFDLIKQSKNTDFKILIGDLTSLIFDNSSINVVQKEDNKPLKYNKQKIDDFKLENNKTYNIELSVHFIDYRKTKYILKISSDTDNKIYEFYSNEMNFERYKSLGFLANHMDIKIENLIIKGDD